MSEFKIQNSVYIAIKENKNLFKKYILSDFFIKNKNAKKFLLYLTELEDIKNVSIDKNKIYSHVFGKDETYNDLKIRHLFSVTNEFIENFLVYNRFLSDTNYKKITLPKIFNNYNHKKSSFEILKENISELKKNNIKDEMYYFQLTELNYLKHDSNYLNSRVQKEDFFEVIDSHLQFSLIRTLRMMCIHRMQNQFSDLQNNDTCYEDYLKISNYNSFSNNYLIQIYKYLFYLTSDHENEENFYTLINLLKTYKNNINEEELKEIYLMASNFCIRKFNNGTKIFGKHFITLATNWIENCISIDNGRIDRFTFTNLITISLKLNDIELSEKFIEKYSCYLLEIDKNDVLNYNQSKIHYFKGDKEKSLIYLTTTPIKDVLWMLNAKVLQLKIYFELEEYLLIDSHLKNLKQYLSRKKNLGYHKNHFKTLFSYFNLLYKFKNSFNKNIKSKISNKLFNEIYPEKDWFVNQI